ncbi:MAG: DNA adenine methylase [Chlorobium sp.]|nr:MAG: DNA adenine methylase [Chlorobium sp.]
MLVTKATHDFQRVFFIGSFMQNKTKSILRYPGSKARFAPLIVNAMKLNQINGGAFAEPFCGGASVSISLLEEGLVDSIFLNDADPLIASLWSCVFNRCDAQWLADKVASISLSIDEWKNQKQLKPICQREAALKCLYLNRTSFNGIIHKSGPIGGWGQKKRSIGVRFNREKLISRILELSHYADKVDVSNQGWRCFCDWIKLRKDTFIYFDPPYYFKAEQLYGYIFDHAEHVVLRDYILHLKSPWLLSYDDALEVRKLYKYNKIQALVIDNTYSTHPLGGSSFIGRELLYSNMNQLPTPDKPTKVHVGITVRSPYEFQSTEDPLRIPCSTNACEKMAI